MRVRRTGFAGLACLALMGCDGLGTTSATLTPLPTTKPVALPTTTTTIVGPLVATAPATIATTAPTTSTTPPETVPPETTTTAERETTTSLASLAPVTTVAVTTTTARAASTTSTSSPTSTTIPARALAKTWIMQLGSAPAGATNEAIASQLAKLRAIAPKTSTLNSGDWRK